MKMLLALAALFSLTAGFTAGQNSSSTPPRAPTGPVYSPEVHPDRKVTFRLRAPNAEEVKVSGEWGGEPATLSKNEEGIWSATIGPLEPEIYGYTFTVDGLRIADPGNPHLKPMRSPTTSIVDIPGDSPLIHELRDLPHGVVSSQPYYSKALGIWRRVHIYTPPGYQDGNKKYPALYLFHGAGDNDATWSMLGRANVILDNLIAEKKTKPMIVVMPDGHPIGQRITGQVGTSMIQSNLEAFERDVLDNVLPLVEKNYRTIAKRDARAIAGLSMGGGQSLHIGLNHPETFGYVAGFSSFVMSPESAEFAIFGDKKPQPVLLWTACGKDDRLVENAKQLSENLQKHGIKHELLVSEGNHSWPLWRKYLAQFAPLLFRGS